MVVAALTYQPGKAIFWIATPKESLHFRVYMVGKRLTNGVQRATQARQTLQIDRQAAAITNVRREVESYLAGEEDREEFERMIEIYAGYYAEEQKSLGIFVIPTTELDYDDDHEDDKPYAQGDDSVQVAVIVPLSKETKSWVDSNMLKGKVYDTIYDIPEVQVLLSPLAIPSP